VKYLNLLGQPRVELDHAGDLPQRDPGLTGIGRHHDDLGTLDVIGK
jgi:hypothetical protein